MAQPSKTLQRACQVLRRRVLFTDAHFNLPGSPFNEDDTDKICDATRLYVETWVLPILQAIEEGNTKELTYLLADERGLAIGEGKQ